MCFKKKIFQSISVSFFLSLRHTLTSENLLKFGIFGHIWQLLLNYWSLFSWQENLPVGRSTITIRSIHIKSNNVHSYQVHIKSNNDNTKTIYYRQCQI